MVPTTSLSENEPYVESYEAVNIVDGTIGINSIVRTIRYLL